MLNSMENNFGMAGGDRSINNAGLSIQYTGIKYYPGVRILNAFLGTNTASLTSRETELLQKARQIVEEARANTASALELETALNDAICDISRYQTNQASGLPETKGLLEGDTAFGALLNGAADCDGYADAFYLLGNLAGFEVRYQHGDTRPAFTGETAEGTHLWNLIKLNGQWYMVDVTWGDREGGYPGAYDYIWLNMGADRALVTHIWDPETAAVPIAPQTDPDLFYFTRQGLQFFSLRDAAEYIANRKNAGQRFVQLMISGAYTGDDDFTDALNAAASGGGRYTYTTREIGEDVFLTVEWE
jgi:transglutaminase-like putative cysteine protease